MPRHDPHQQVTDPDERQVRELVARRADALRTKDAAATLATQTPDYVQFPLFGPLRFAGPTALTLADLEAAFAGFEGPIGYDVDDLRFTIGDRVAVSRSLSRFTARTRGGATTSFWFRKTLVMEKRGTAWLISLEHESLPARPDGSSGLDEVPSGVTGDGPVTS